MSSAAVRSSRTRWRGSPTAGKIPLVLGGDHTVTWPDVTGVARSAGFGRVSIIHFDAHADTGDIEFGSLYGHGQPMRRLIESGAARGDRFLQLGLRGYWPGPETLDWMADQQMRSFHMSEIVAKGLDQVLDEAFVIATDDCDGVFLSVDIDVCDPGHAPGTGTPEPGGLTARQLLDAVSRICYEVPVSGSTSSRSPRPTTMPRSPPSSATGSCWRRCRGSPGGAKTAGRCSGTGRRPSWRGAARSRPAQSRRSSCGSGTP